LDCKTAILSNDYFDAITDFPIWVLEENLKNLCYASIENFYNVVYFERSLLEDTDEYFFSYRSLPKLYGLMQEGITVPAGFDPNSLIASGITQIQRNPLALTGRGTVICIIDTGERVIILSGWRKPGKSKDSR